MPGGECELDETANKNVKLVRRNCRKSKTEAIQLETDGVKLRSDGVLVKQIHSSQGSTDEQEGWSRMRRGGSPYLHMYDVAPRHNRY